MKPVIWLDWPNCDGLTAGRFQKPPHNWPNAPSYYDVLVARDAEAVVLPGGRAARRLPYAIGETEVFMLSSGALRCLAALVSRRFAS